MADTQMRQKRGGGGCWLKQPGTQSHVPWAGFGCLWCLFYPLLYSIDRAAFRLIGYVYVCKNRHYPDNQLLLKHPQHGQSVFTLPAANLISRLQAATPPHHHHRHVIYYHNLQCNAHAWAIPAVFFQDLEQEKIQVQNAFNIRREDLNDGFDLAKAQHRSCIL